jgi:kynurenine formamidase
MRRALTSALPLRANRPGGIPLPGRFAFWSRVAALALTTLLALADVPAFAADSAALDGRLVDLTHPFAPGVMVWPGGRPFVLEKTFEGVTERGYYYAANSFCMAEHTGTHIDAPLHFHRDGVPVDRIPLERLIAPALVVDVSAAARTDRDYLVGVADLEAFEKAHGAIPAGAIVLLRTGFGALWADRARYAGTASTEAAAAAALHFPGLDPRAAEWLVARRIAAVGLDTPSIDHGPATHFESHVVLAKAGVPAFENLANLDQLPARGFTVIALPMMIAGGSGGPLRIVAVMPR